MVASLLDTKNPDTQYTLYVMYNTLSDDLKHKLEDIVDNRAIVNHIDMSSEFPLFKECNWNVTTMYRLAIAEHLKNVDKIIYIDGDCLVFDDLTNMYKIEIGDNLFMGQADDATAFKIYCKIMKTDFKKYICAGVMLMNLKLLRECKFKDKVNDYLKEHNGDTILFGSGNMDYRSLFQLHETGAYIKNKELGNTIKEHFNKIIGKSKIVNKGHISLMLSHYANNEIVKALL